MGASVHLSIVNQAHLAWFCLGPHLAIRWEVYWFGGLPLWSPEVCHGVGRLESVGRTAGGCLLGGPFNPSKHSWVRDPQIVIWLLFGTEWGCLRWTRQGVDSWMVPSGQYHHLPLGLEHYRASIWPMWAMSFSRTKTLRVLHIKNMRSGISAWCAPSESFWAGPLLGRRMMVGPMGAGSIPWGTAIWICKLVISMVQSLQAGDVIHTVAVST